MATRDALPTQAETNNARNRIRRELATLSDDEIAAKAVAMVAMLQSQMENSLIFSEFGRILFREQIVDAIIDLAQPTVEILNRAFERATATE